MKKSVVNMKKGTCFIFIFIGFLLSGCQTEENKSVKNPPITTECEIPYEREKAEISVWQRLIEEKLIEEYGVDQNVDIMYNYAEYRESEMGTITVPVTSEKKHFEVSFPGSNGFLFDVEGATIIEESSLTDENLKYNIDIEIK